MTPPPWALEPFAEEALGDADQVAEWIRIRDTRPLPSTQSRYLRLEIKLTE